MDKPNILIIDDDPKKLWLIKESFLGNQYNFTNSDDGVEGFNNIRTNSYDLVLLNMLMPRANGLWILKKLKEFNIKIPIIISSLFEYDYIQSITEEFDIECIISGDFDLMALSNEIRRILNK